MQCLMLQAGGLYADTRAQRHVPQADRDHTRRPAQLRAAILLNASPFPSCTCWTSTIATHASSLDHERIPDPQRQGLRSSATTSPSRRSSYAYASAKTIICTNMRRKKTSTKRQPSSTRSRGDSCRGKAHVTPTSRRTR
jgi:hypothetical protein